MCHLKDKTNNDGKALTKTPYCLRCGVAQAPTHGQLSRPSQLQPTTIDLEQ